MVKPSLSATTKALADPSGSAEQAEVVGLNDKADVRGVDDTQHHYRRHAQAVLRSAASTDEGLRAALRAALAADQE